MHHGVRCWHQRRREGSGGVVADIAKLSVAGRSTAPASWPPTTSSICPATASPQATGTAPPPPGGILHGCLARRVTYQEQVAWSAG